MKIYTIDYKYIKYLRIYDKKVKYKMNRPYIGILKQKNDKHYFFPLTSTNFEIKDENGKSKYNPLVMVSLKKGELGTISLNNAIPVNLEDCHIYNIHDINDELKKEKLIKISRLIRNDNFSKKIDNKFSTLLNTIENPKHKKLKDSCCNWDTNEVCCDMYKIIKENEELHTPLRERKLLLIKDNPTKLKDKVNDEIIDLENLDYDNEYEEDDYDM